MEFLVIGPVDIGGVAPGGRVTLDPSVINIDVLIEAGHITPIQERRRVKPEEGE